MAMGSGTLAWAWACSQSSGTRIARAGSARLAGASTTLAAIAPMTVAMAFHMGAVAVATTPIPDDHMVVALANNKP